MSGWGLRPKARDAVARVGRRPWATTAGRGAVRASRRVDRWAPPALTILTYHRVAPERSDGPLSPTMRNADPEEFARQLDLVGAVGNPVSLAQVRRALEGDAELPAHPVLITFDDAYRDFADHAWPELRRRGVPAAMFVATAYPDDPRRAFWWDRVWAALDAGARPHPDEVVLDPTVGGDTMSVFRAMRDHLKALPHRDAMEIVDALASRADGPSPEGTVLGWDELRELHDEGLAVGAHSHTHPLLTRLSPEEAAQEIGRSVDELRARGFADASVLAYPGGAHDPDVRAAAARVGCSMAMTTDRGVNRLDALDRFRLRRINVGQRTSPALLAAQLVPSLSRARRWAP